MHTPPGGLAIPPPLRCPRCDHLTSYHWPDERTEEGHAARPGCHAAFAEQTCLCSFTPEEIVAATVLDRIETVVETGEAPPLPRTSMVTAVTADLNAMPPKPGGVNGSLRALAMYLAEAVDAHAATPGANPSTTARLAQELRTVLSEIARQDDSVDEEVAEFIDSLGVPERGAE
jgi:hypothetical protein